MPAQHQVIAPTTTPSLVSEEELAWGPAYPNPTFLKPAACLLRALGRPDVNQKADSSSQATHGMKPAPPGEKRVRLW